jgi:hypothetical protein
MAVVVEQLGVDETSIYKWGSNLVGAAVPLIPKIIQFLDYYPY